MGLHEMRAAWYYFGGKFTPTRCRGPHLSFVFVVVSGAQKMIDILANTWYPCFPGFFGQLYCCVVQLVWRPVCRKMLKNVQVRYDTSTQKTGHFLVCRVEASFGVNILYWKISLQEEQSVKRSDRSEAQQHPCHRV